MTTQGDIDYFKNLTEGDRLLAYNQPFLPRWRCGDYLMQFGAILQLLPEPPAKVLDLGCGTGWTSRFMAQAGYFVTGVDISPEAIEISKQKALIENVKNVEFSIGDYESLNYQEEFDVVLFFASLHHATNEELAIKKAYESLKNGGKLITFEPGEGHEDSEDTLNEVSKYGCTEKNMSPAHIFDIGKKQGFSKFKFYPRLSVIETRKATVLNPGRLKNVFKILFKREKLYISKDIYNLNYMGITALTK